MFASKICVFLPGKINSLLLSQEFWRTIYQVHIIDLVKIRLQAKLCVSSIYVNMPKEAFYAVANGRKVGIFSTWDECSLQVNKFQNARYKKFPDETSAKAFIEQYKTSVSTKSSNTQSVFPNRPTSETVSSTTTDVSMIHKLNPKKAPGPSWRVFQNQLPKPNPVLPSGMSSTRSISTTAVSSKRKFAVTEDRVVPIKRLKSSHQVLDFNSEVDLTKFTTDDDGYIVVYTDGACKGNGKRGALAGIGVWFGDNHYMNISEPVEGIRSTNNTAEIQAAEKAIKKAKEAGINKLCIKTDSQFLINCITKWMTSWKRNGWKLSDGKPVKNREDLEKLSTAAANVQIKWSYVPGHKGHYGNEAADSLAVAGSQKALKT